MFRPANPDLRPERLWSYELSLSQRLWEGRLSYGINLFYIDGENLILRMPVNGRQMNVNTGRIENAGVEAEIAYRISAAWASTPIQFPAHGASRAGRSRTQTPRRSLLHAGPLVGLDGPAIRGGVSTLRSSSEGRAATHRKISSLWNLRAGFRISRKLRIFVDGENLLAQRYEINAGFPMPRATVLGGLDMHF